MLKQPYLLVNCTLQCACDLWCSNIEKGLGGGRGVRILERITTFPSTFVKIVFFWIFFNFVFSSSYVRKSIERHKLGENKKVRTTTKKRSSIAYPSSIKMVVVGRHNLTVFEPTSTGSVLVKEGQSPTTSRLARLALGLLSAGSSVPSLMWRYWYTTFTK